MIDLKDKTVAITGSASMIGRCTVETLKQRGAHVIEVPHKDMEGNIINDLTRPNPFCYGFWDEDIDYLFHLGGHNGSIAFNSKYPADIAIKTALMGINIVNEAIYYNTELGGNLKKIVFIAPSCALTPGKDELSEEDFYVGNCHESVACHGESKRFVDFILKQAEKQYGIKSVTAIANNSFGPYDHYNELKGKVVSGLIRRLSEAKRNGDLFFECWGSGVPLREFIYCKDVGEGLVQVLEKFDGPDPIILTSGYEISIKDLVYKIADKIGYKGSIQFDTSKPDGQMRKRLSKSKMDQYLNVPITDFDTALQETIDWYEKAYCNYPWSKNE